MAVDKIYVAGHRGMVGSAIVRALTSVIASEARQSPPDFTLVTRTHAELDLTNQAAVQAFFAAEKPDQVYLAAAKVGGSTPTTPTRPSSFTKT
jgi:GDP-L-fucose synthase